MNNSQESLVEHTDNKKQRGRPRRKWKASIKPLGTVRHLHRTGVSLLSRERFLYI